jgi:Spy/CpxP family protein refolding chaperone
VVNAWKIVLASLAIFAAGVLTGALATRLARPIVRPPVEMAAPAIAGSNSLAARPGMVRMPGSQRLDSLQRMLESQLDLAPEQREQVQRILKDGRDAMRRHWDPIEPRLREENRRIWNDIRQALRPEQRQKLEELLFRKRATETNAVRLK